MSEIRLSIQEIADKEFKSGMSGYKKDDVDTFLDIVIKDYETFNRELDRLYQDNEKLRRQVKSLSRNGVSQQPGTSNSGQQSANGGNGMTNFDILMRISNLEKAVFAGRMNGKVNSTED